MVTVASKGNRPRVWTAQTGQCTCLGRPRMAPSGRHADIIEPMTELTAGAPTDDVLHALLQTIITRLMQLLTRRGVLVEDMGQTYLAEPDADGDEARTLRPLQAAAVTYRIASGPVPGKRC